MAKVTEEKLEIHSALLSTYEEEERFFFRMTGTWTSEVVYAELGKFERWTEQNSI